MEKLGSTAKAQIWVCVWPELYIYTHTYRTQYFKHSISVVTAGVQYSIVLMKIGSNEIWGLFLV